MRPAWRQRIIGFGLLVLLLLILVPWATQVPDRLQLRLNDAIPPAPEIHWQTLAPTISSETHQKTDADVSSERAKMVADTPDGKSRLQAYALKLAQYATQAQALAERQRLNDAGYPAYVREQTGGFALFAGPELDLPRLQAMQQRLGEDQHFPFPDQQVVSYRP